MNGLMRAIVVKVLNGVVMAGGGSLVAHGWASSSDATKFEGSVIFLIGFGFHLYDAWKVKAKVEAAHATPPAEPLPPALQ